MAVKQFKKNCGTADHFSIKKKSWKCHIPIIFGFVKFSVLGLTWERKLNFCSCLCLEIAFTAQFSEIVIYMLFSYATLL